MIGYWQRPVSPSVRPSVCDAVHCGSQSQRRCTGLRLYTSVFNFLAVKLTYLSLQTMLLYTEFFWDRQSGVHWSCYVLLLTDFVHFSQSRLSVLTLGAYCVHKLYPLNWIVRKLTSRSTCNLNRIDSCLYAVAYVIGSTIGYHSNSWASCFISTVTCMADNGRVVLSWKGELGDECSSDADCQEGIDNSWCMSLSDSPGGSTSINGDISQGTCACQHGYRQDGPLTCRHCE